jgi:hypothetical protein
MVELFIQTPLTSPHKSKPVEIESIGIYLGWPLHFSYLVEMPNVPVLTVDKTMTREKALLLLEQQQGISFFLLD